LNDHVSVELTSKPIFTIASRFSQNAVGSNKPLRRTDEESPAMLPSALTGDAFSFVEEEGGFAATPSPADAEQEPAAGKSLGSGATSIRRLWWRIRTAILSVSLR
jgi:hypothetical protein